MHTQRYMGMGKGNIGVPIGVLVGYSYMRNNSNSSTYIIYKPPLRNLDDGSYEYAYLRP